MRTRNRRQTYVSAAYSRETWSNLFDLAHKLFVELGKLGSHRPYDLEVMFGATAIADDSDPSEPYKCSWLTADDHKAWEKRLEHAKLDREFWEFIDKRTAFRVPPENKTPAKGITQCGMVGNYVLAAADGQYYPCCVTAARSVCSLGKIGEMTPAGLAASRQQFHDSRTPPWCASGCRVRNHTFLGPKAWPETAQ